MTTLFLFTDFCFHLTCPQFIWKPQCAFFLNAKTDENERPQDNFPTISILYGDLVGFFLFFFVTSEINESRRGQGAAGGHVIQDDQDTWGLGADKRRAGSSGAPLMCPCVSATTCDGWLMRPCNLKLSPRAGLPSLLPLLILSNSVCICTQLSDRLTCCFTKSQRNEGTRSSSSVVTTHLCRTHTGHFTLLPHLWIFPDICLHQAEKQNK